MERVWGGRGCYVKNNGEGRVRKRAWGRLAATQQYCHRILLGSGLFQGGMGITVLGMSSGRHGMGSGSGSASAESASAESAKWGTEEEKVTVRKKSEIQSLAVQFC